MPGRKWYVLAGIVLVVGLCAFAAILFFGLRGLGEGFDRFVAPGAATIDIEEPGSYTIYREQGSLDGVYYDYVNLPAIRVVVTAPSGTELPLLTPTMDETYSFGGRRGYSIFRFQTAETGAHRVEAFYPGGESSPQGILVVGRGFTKNLLFVIFAAIGTMFGTIFLTLAIAITTFVMRYRAGKRRARAQAPAAPPGSPAPPVVP
jgi:hypothetical protein